MHENSGRSAAELEEDVVERAGNEVCNGRKEKCV